jgi:RNA polymerase sigma factor (sigma-70 family)
MTERLPKSLTFFSVKDFAKKVVKDQDVVNLNPMSEIERQRAHTFVAESYEKYGNELRRYLHRRMKGHPDARDLAQEVWRRLLRVRDTKQVIEPLAYIYRAAANVIAEYHHLRARDCVSADSEAMEYASEHPAETARDELADQLVRQAELQRILAAMPKTYRDVLLMRTAEGRSYEEIGQKLQFSPKTVEQYFFRAMAIVRKSRREGTDPCL